MGDPQEKFRKPGRQDCREIGRTGSDIASRPEVDSSLRPSPGWTRGAACQKARAVSAAGRHLPVLLKEVLQWLDPQPGQRFIDATISGGGHAVPLAEKIAPNGQVLGIERDPELFKQFQMKVEGLRLKERIVLTNDNYVNVRKIAKERGFEGADGILFDLGISSWHVDASGRGFSFQREEGLDMRFDPRSGVSAFELVNTWTEAELKKIIREFGEEPFAGRIARAIVKARQEGVIKTSARLAEVVQKVVPRRGRINPATKTFQALRMTVNDELENIRKGLAGALSILKSGGRLAVISFHGLEDKIVKTFFREAQRQGLIEILTPKVISPTREEVEANPRSRSAKMRVVWKV